MTGVQTVAAASVQRTQAWFLPKSSVGSVWCQQARVPVCLDLIGEGDGSAKFMQ
jgi:hypothetical protein